MPSPNRRRGFGYEREVVKDAEDAGFTAERAYGSNGRALGEAETVDLLINGIRVQCKRRKKLPEYLKIPEGADVVMTREDRGESLVILPLSEWFRLIKKEE